MQKKKKLAGIILAAVLTGIFIPAEAAAVEPGYSYKAVGINWNFPTVTSKTTDAVQMSAGSGGLYRYWGSGTFTHDYKSESGMYSPDTGYQGYLYTLEIYINDMQINNDTAGAAKPSYNIRSEIESVKVTASGGLNAVSVPCFFMEKNGVTSHYRAHVMTTGFYLDFSLEIKNSYSFEGSLQTSLPIDNKVELTQAVQINRRDGYAWNYRSLGEAQIQNQIISTGTNILNKMEQMRGSLWNKMEDNRSSLVSTINAKGDDIINKLESNRVSLVSTINKKGDDIIKKIGDEFTELERQINDKYWRWDELFKQYVTNIITEINDEAATNRSHLTAQTTRIVNEINDEADTNRRHLTAQNTRLIESMGNNPEYRPPNDGGSSELEAGFSSYDKAESQVTDQASAWINSFNFTKNFTETVNSVPTEAFTAASAMLSSIIFQNQFLSTFVILGLVLITAGVIIGIFRYRS